MKRVSAYLIVVALIAGMMGCGPAPGFDLEIRDWYGLDAVRHNLAGRHRLMNDLDSTSPGYNELASPSANQGRGWLPIGDTDKRFSGRFSGNGHEIRDLFIDRPGEGPVGLFGVVHLGVIHGVGASNATVTGCHWVGSLAGYVQRGTVSYSYFSGNLTGNNQIGGLVGQCDRGIIENSYAAGNVTGDLFVGGLVGVSGGNVTNSVSTASVSGDEGVGGLVGYNSAGTVDNSRSDGTVVGRLSIGGLVGVTENDGILTNSSSTATVTGSQMVGGLVGSNLRSNVSKCASTGIVTGEQAIGGLVGFNTGAVAKAQSTSSVSGDISLGGLVGINAGNVTNTYASGPLFGERFIGGLVGRNEGGSIDNSYAVGNVTANQDPGGLVGVNDEGTVSDSFWDVQTSGMDASDGGTSKTTAEMMDIATFTDTATEGLDEPWDMAAVEPGKTDDAYTWSIVDGQTYPFLSWQSVP